jgi:hypothetical protein
MNEFIWLLRFFGEVGIALQNKYAESYVIPGRGKKRGKKQLDPYYPMQFFDPHKKFCDLHPTFVPENPNTYF